MKSRHLGVGIVLAFLMAACGSSKQAGDAPKSFEGINYPDWVLKGGGAFGGDSGRVFYGVGCVSGVKDLGVILFSKKKYIFFFRFHKNNGILF